MFCPCGTDPRLKKYVVAKFMPKCSFELWFKGCRSYNNNGLNFANQVVTLVISG
jgi:hypothetical protein